jgi:DNA-binding transcriptional LysR family regulator
VFDDPLFVRTPRGVVPTERALALAGPVREGLATLRQALSSPVPFDPRSSERTFVLAASDYVEFVLLGPLLQRITEEAPGVRLEIRPWGKHEVPGDLAEGAVDLMIGYYDAVPPGHRDRLLFDEQYACILRKGHPMVGKRLTLNRYVELSHVLVSQVPGALGSVDRALAKLGLTRKVGARVSHFLMVPVLVAETDMVAAISRRIAVRFGEPFGLRVFPPPLPLPRSRVGQVWHERTDGDPAQRWLRELIAQVSAKA